MGRFAQADSIIPLESQGVQAWDRYAGMNNNPVRYNDPSGHRACDDLGCDGEIRYKKRTSPPPPPQPPQPQSNNQACTGSNQNILCLPKPTSPVSPVPILPSGPIPVLPTSGPSYYPGPTSTPIEQSNEPVPVTKPIRYGFDPTRIDGWELLIDAAGIVTDGGTIVFPSAAVPLQTGGLVVDIAGAGYQAYKVYKGEYGAIGSLSLDVIENTIENNPIIAWRLGRAAPLFGIVANGVSIVVNVGSGFYEREKGVGYDG